MEIGGAEALASLEVPPGASVYAAVADIKNCFYQAGLPTSLCEFFCLEAVSVSEAIALGFEVFTDGTPLVGNDAGLVDICLIVLPMGWTWAFWFIQRFHQYQLELDGFSADRGNIIVGAWPPRELDVSPSSLPYCDNLTFVGTCPSRVRAARDKSVSRFNDAGFELHEISDVASLSDVLGFELGAAEGGAPLASRVA